MRLVLTAVDSRLADSWQRFCGDLPGVIVHRGSILDVDCDAVVSPANSFGFMDGGVDAVYLRFFGSHVQEEVQRAIRAHHAGELLVGAATVVETGHARIPYLIVAPTMRVPMVLNESVNPFLAARAVLLLVTQGAFAEGRHVAQPLRSRIQTVAFPGLGTGVGQVPAPVCAHQVRVAIDQVLLKNHKEPRTWAEASEQHQLLYTEKPRRLQC